MPPGLQARAHAQRLAAARDPGDRRADDVHRRARADRADHRRRRARDAERVRGHDRHAQRRADVGGAREVAGGGRARGSSSSSRRCRWSAARRRCSCCRPDSSSPSEAVSVTPCRGVPVITGDVTLVGAPPNVPLSARSAFTRPPVTERPVRSARASTEPMIALLTSSAVDPRPGRQHGARRRPPCSGGDRGALAGTRRPATGRYERSRCRARARPRWVAPKLENDVGRSFSSEVPTQRTSAAGDVQGPYGVASLLTLSLPAAIT